MADAPGASKQKHSHSASGRVATSPRNSPRPSFSGVRKSPGASPRPSFSGERDSINASPRPSFSTEDDRPDFSTGRDLPVGLALRGTTGEATGKRDLDRLEYPRRIHDAPIAEPQSPAVAIPETEDAADIPMTMTASVILTALPKNSKLALEDAEKEGEAKGECLSIDTSRSSCSSSI
jgi:hypothetical protein